jgi:ribosomal-protein-alanine N-acetyltransferase
MVREAWLDFAMHRYSTLTITTERLELRPLVDGDAVSLFAIHSDPEVMRYWSTPPWSELQVAIDCIAKDKLSAADGLCFRLGIFLRGDDSLLGTCSLFHIDDQCRRAEIGYGLASHAWGRGYATEAMAAVLACAFGEMQLNRIEADIDPRNERSARALERQGFVREGLLRERWLVAGQKSDSALYGLLAADFPIPKGLA